MLEYLRIRNVAIIEDVELELGPGLCVVTGETGAGKSILVGALRAVRGARLSRESIRDGATEAQVEAVFRTESTDPNEEGTRLISRVLSSRGRSRQRIDGELSTAARLAEVGTGLLDISSQHDGQMLTDSGTHGGLLDDFGVKPDRLQTVREAVTHLQELAARLRQLSVDERERAARLDLLTYQLREIEAMAPQAGEEESLEAERRRLASAADLERLSREAVGVLYEDESAAVELVGRGERLVTEVAALDEALAPLVGRLTEARVVIDDVSRELERYANSVEGDPQRLETVEARLSELGRLCRKHGVRVEGLVALGERLAREVEDLEGADERIQSLQSELEDARQLAKQAARRLTDARKRAARRLEKAVEANLERLGMDRARFQVRLEPRPTRRSDEPALVYGNRRLSVRGWDRVEFFIAPNPGEEPLPLARTASGGELSRIMLAIKLVLAERDSVGTYVFDEVDAGVGGVAAGAVGLALAEVARHRQVVCISHLPQIAAFADQHFYVEKRTRGARTVATLSELDPKERTEELARMLGGSRVTKTTRAAAAELVKTAQQQRRAL